VVRVGKKNESSAAKGGAVMYYRLKQDGLTFRWYPQYRRGEVWNNYVGAKGIWRAFATIEEGHAFFASKNPKWEFYYEGEKAAKPRP
jgi:hypothetical protein